MLGYGFEITINPFQFTHPGRGATSLPMCSRTCATFQFTHPGRGATKMVRILRTQHTCFNSRTPGGVRHPLIKLPCSVCAFQFTHPGRGATVLH